MHTYCALPSVDFFAALTAFQIVPLVSCADRRHCGYHNALICDMVKMKACVKLYLGIGTYVRQIVNNNSNITLT